MKALIALVRKELRDQRGLLLAAALLAPAISVLIAWIFRGRYIDEVAGKWVLPGLLLFFLASLAAEFATRDVESGVGETFSRLPIPRRLPWIAKLAALFVCGVLFTGWLLGTEWVWRRAVGLPAERVLDSFLGAGLAHGIAIVAALAAFALGVLTRKGFASAAFAIALVAGPIYFAPDEGSLVSDGGWFVALALWPLAWWPLVVGSAFTAAGLAAFDLRVSRPGDLLRRSSIFGAVLLAGIGPAAAAGVLRYRSAFVIDPRAPDVQVSRAVATSDGRWIALELVSMVTLRQLRARVLRQVWVLDTRTNELIEVPGLDRWIAARACDSHAIWRGGNQLLTARHAGFSAGEVWDVRDGSLTAFEGPPPWIRSRSLAAEGFPDGFEVRWRDRQEVFRCPEGDFVAQPPVPGIFFYLDSSGRLRRHDLASGEDVVLREGIDFERHLSASVSPDGRRIVVQDSIREGRAIYLDATSGESHFEAQSDGWHHDEWTGLEHPWAMLRSYDFEQGTLHVRFVDDDGGWEVRFDDFVQVQCLEDGRLLVTHTDGRCEVLDHQGRPIQNVFPLSADVTLRRAGSASNP